jgi:MFS family permease
MRLVVGFCYSGIYVVAESWLNESSTNENRGQTLSAYLIMQMLGIIVAQSLINIADPGGYNLFINKSVAVSISVAPIHLSASPAPVFSSTPRMSLRQLFKASPLGCVGIFFLGAIFGAQFGMGPVYGTEVGLTPAEISIFIGAIFGGGLVLQYPIGWLSDRMDRRALIVMVTALGAVSCLVALIFEGSFPALVLTAFLVGGTSNPLYSLLIAHTNDFLEHEDMASASGGLIVLNGIGAAGTPILVGYLMEEYGTASFLYFIAVFMTATAVYATYRRTVRPAPATEDTSAIAPYSMVSGTQITAEIAQEMAAEHFAADENTG